jgi:hypothetical protein
MTRVLMISFLSGALSIIAVQPALSAATNQAPEFQEIYGLIRTHAAGVSDADLNQAAVQGLLTALGPRVMLVSNGGPAPAQGGIPLLRQTNRFDGAYASLQIGRVGNGLAEAVHRAYEQLNSTNPLKGLVIDLRFADGTDYAAAAAVADLFSTKSVPLLNWGEGMVSSHEKKDALRLPIAVLVNHETTRAAEALAALLRLIGTGLILGRNTAGQAMVMQDFPLKDGEHLRIATVPLTLGDGSALSPQGIRPDIIVAVSPASELAYYRDAYAVPPAADLTAGARSSLENPTNIASAVVHTGRLNEAELVRQHKQGLTQSATSGSPARMSEAELVREHRQSLDGDDAADDDAGSTPRSETAVPVVKDPTLARALDLLKGLAVMQQNRL